MKLTMIFFPAPVVKETVFSPLYGFASFVKDKVSKVPGFISGLSILSVP